MKWLQLPLGAFQTNCYIVYEESGEALIIDPGSEPERVNHFLKEQNLTPLTILLTHAHLDHIGAVDDLKETWKIPVYVHEKEGDWLGDPVKNGSAHFPGFGEIRLNPADGLFNQEETKSLGTFTFSIFETPGHSPGSVSFYFPEDRVIFSGDTLFYGSIGRTDLYGGSTEGLMKSIESKLLTLPDETIVCPGHGFETTIKNEKETNPFLF